MLNIVVPMAGAGSRFASRGYSRPKPFIDVLGRPMIERVLQNLMIPNAKFVLVIQREHLEIEASFLRKLCKNYPIEFVPVDGLTEGAACSVMCARRFIDNANPLMIANCDQIVDCDFASYIRMCTEQKLDGFVLTFQDNDPKWSYAKTNEDGLISVIREKKVISTHATAGIYYFSHGSDFVDFAIDMIVRGDRVNNEFYVAPVYNYAVCWGKKNCIFEINKEQMHGIGTPDDLNAYIETILHTEQG